MDAVIIRSNVYALKQHCLEVVSWDGLCFAVRLGLCRLLLLAAQFVQVVCLFIASYTTVEGNPLGVGGGGGGGGGEGSLKSSC